MKKHPDLFECIECGYQSPKYFGKCPRCDNWNSMVEIPPRETRREPGAAGTRPVVLADVDRLDIRRQATGIDEFDRALGGGIVPGSVILIGGEPGVGKSTLLLGISGALAGADTDVVYLSGEESAQQIKTRADRMGIDSKRIHLITMGNLADLKAAVEELSPRYLVVDSIQTIQSGVGAGGTGSSMRLVTAELIELAKTGNLSVFIIGHITKEGQIAGPKTLEHMVDVVLYFQGELRSDLRILRAEKNRFGPVNELGVFQMTGDGLTSVKDPSQLFYQHRKSPESGVAVFPTMSGLRAIVIELQALASESPFAGNPRRVAVGFDAYRLSMLISVIEKKLKLPFYKSDVFLNIAGGLTIRETAGDLAVIAALVSSTKNIALPYDLALIGETGLTGEVRPVGFLENRVKEAQRQGFKEVMIPAVQLDGLGISGIKLHPVESIHDMYGVLRSFTEKRRGARS